MLDQFSRTKLMFNKDGMARLFASKVAVFGIGGVGGYAVEALVRSGVGTLDLFDDDKICLTNLNRQLHATHSTIGLYKVDVAAERALEINPDVVVHPHRLFYLPESSGQVDLSVYDYVIDAIDTVSGKIELIMQAKKHNVSIICSMGAGNKINASAFEVADIYDTSICPLAKVMRHELRKRSVDRLKVVYSKEQPMAPLDDLSASCNANCVCPPGTARKCTKRRQIPGSNAFVPAAVGLIVAGEVICDLAAAW